MVSNSVDLNKTRYTRRDYESIKSDLIDSISSLTQEWTSREDSDPGIVLVKLMAMFGDTLSYNIDKIALELYMSSVSQRKNCAKILRLLGYKMHWYRSARVIAHVRLSDSKDSQGNLQRVLMYPYRTKFYAGTVTYSVASQGIGSGEVDIYSNTQTVPVKLIQGRRGQDTFKKEDLVLGNRYYLSVSNVDETEFLLEVSGGKKVTCELVDNLYLMTGTSKVYYEFNVDEYDRPYIQLVDNWEDIVGSETALFSLTYIITDGSIGNVTSNAFTLVDELKSGSFENLVITNLPNTTKYGVDDQSLDSYNCPGSDPQTVEVARRDSSNYVFTHDSLVTSFDYEKASKRVDGITVSKFVDAQVILKDSLNLLDIVHRGLDNQKVGSKQGKDVEYNDDLIKEVEEVSETDPDKIVTNYYLVSYASLLYLAYRNFDAYYNYYFTTLSKDSYGGDWCIRYDESGNPVDADEAYSIVTPKLKEVGYYPYRPLENICQSVRDQIKGLHTLNVSVDFGSLKLFPFKVKGILHLTEPTSPQETLQIVHTVDDALKNAYYPDLHDIGERPNFIEIVDVIQGSDVRIKYFDAVGQIVDWAPAIDTNATIKDEEGQDIPNPVYIENIFDTTSAILYNGLSSQFNIDKKFMSFKLRNVGASPDSSDDLLGSTEYETAIPTDYSTAYLKNYSSAAGLSTIQTIPVGQIVRIDTSNIPQLTALCQDLTYKGRIDIKGRIEKDEEPVDPPYEKRVDAYGSVSFDFSTWLDRKDWDGLVVENIVIKDLQGLTPFKLRSISQNGISYSLAETGESSTQIEITKQSEFVRNEQTYSGEEIFNQFFLNPFKPIVIDIDFDELFSSTDVVAQVTATRAKFVEDQSGTYHKSVMVNNSGLQWTR